METKKYIAVPDGKTDNSDILQKYITEFASDEFNALVLPPGIYAISRTLELPLRISLQLSPGACLRALPGFDGDAVVRKAPDSSGEHIWSGTISGGQIDGGKQDLIGIHAVGSCRLDIHDIEIADCLQKGIFMGTEEKTWGYEANIRGVRCAIDMNTPHSPGSIGIHYKHITDSYINQVVIIGYETGVSSESSANDFSQVHVWNVPAQGPLKNNFYCNGWGDSYSQCYADAPFDDGNECYGFVVNKPFNRFTNCRVYCNNFTYDNTVVGFQILDQGTHGTYIGNLLTGKAENRIKSAFAGNLEAATIIGNCYDPSVINGRENCLPSDTGGISHIPQLKINKSPLSLSHKPST